jgi:hypothetical protein
VAPHAGGRRLAEEELTTEEVIRRHRLAMEKFEDDADLHADAAKKAAAEGDDVTAQREKKKAASAERKAKIERDRKARAEADAGKIRAGHASRAQTKTGITARKGSMLNREQIEEVFVKGLMKYITEEQVDQVTGETIPCEDAAKIRRFALAILSGNTDFVSVLREYYVSNDVWTLPAGLTKDAPPAKKGKPKPKDDDEDDDDEVEEGSETEDRLDDDELEFDPDLSDEHDAPDLDAELRTMGVGDKMWD